MYNNFLVLGATGKTGRIVADNLTKLGKNVRHGSRKAEVPFSWDDSSNWNEVVKNIEAVYITFQPDLAVPGAYDKVKLFTQNALNAGVKKLVLLSGKGEKEAERSEKVLMDSGADWTIVRATWFNQNFSEGFFLEPILAGHVAMPDNGIGIPFIDTKDIADVVTEALLKSEHNSQIYELTSNEKFTLTQAVAEIAKAANRDIKFTNITIEDYKALLRQFEVPEDYIWLITYLFEETTHEKNQQITGDVEKVLNRKPISFPEYVAVTAQTGIWTP